MTKAKPKAKHKPHGRPRFDGKPEDEVLRHLETAFKFGCTDEEACFYADISPAALYRYEEKNPEFRERKALFKLDPVVKARKAVVEKLERDPDLALKYLERTRKKEFGLHSTVEHEGMVGTYKLSDKEKEEVIEIMKKSKEQK